MTELLPAYPAVRRCCVPWRVRDLVLVGGDERVVLGSFDRYFADPARRWGEPDARAIARARVVAIDPYFPACSERAAAYALEAGKPYVTIDCPFDSELHAGARATVASREYRRQRCAALSDDELFREYARRSSGLTLFTSGNQPIVFGRGGTPPSALRPFACR